MAAAPTSAPPNFYDNLPAGSDMPPQGAAPQKKSDADEDLIKGLSQVYRVLGKMGEAKPTLKVKIDDIKDKVKDLFVNGLKANPADLETGETKTAEPPPAAKPKTNDETHAA